MRRYAAIAITVLGLFGEASAAPKIAKGDDKYAETANPEAKNRKVSFVSKVHEPGLPLRYSTYLMKGTDASAAPVFVMMEQDENATPPKMETFAAEGLIPPGLVVFVMNDSLMPTVKGGFPRYMRGEAFGRAGRGFPSVLIDELIPVAAKSCGVTVSNDPDMHFIMGSSAGGGATLNAVWFRNDYFRRAYAASPSLDALRGGEDILRLIRMTEAKPLRIFISTGDREPDRTGGDLFYDDMQLRTAFDFAGYPCELMYFPTGGHNAGVGNVDMLRRMFAFVWKDWRTTKIVPPRNPVRVASLVADGTAWAECKASVPAKRSVSAAGGVYSCDGGRIVFTKGGSSKPVAECFSRVEAISLSSDGWRLYVVDASRRDIFALTVESDGSLGFPFQLAPIRLAHDATRLSATDLLTLENDRVLAATELGVQSSLSFGALDVVLPLPGDLPVDRIWMDGRTLYALSGRRVFRRELLVAAARDDVITKPLSAYYAIPGENKYSDHRPQFEAAYRTLKPVVVTNRIQVAAPAEASAAAPVAAAAPGPAPKKADLLVVSEATVAYRTPRTSWLGTNFCVAAAQDVARVLGKAVGREIACVKEESLPAGAKNVIYVGDTVAAKAAGLDVSTLPAQDCLLRCDGDRAFIAARTGMGVNNGAVEFLQRFADFFFVSFWGGDEPVTRNPALAIPRHDARVTPAIRNRSMYSGSVPDGQKAYRQRVRLQPDGFGRRMEFMRRQRLFLINAECDDLDRVSAQTQSCHSQFDYLPAEQYFKDHPEYYSMGKDGKRHGTPNRGSQLCFTNPDVLELVYRSMVGFIEADRKADPANYPKIYDFTQMDSCRILCECPSCRAVKAKYNRVKGGYAEGGDTGLQLEFVNKLARRIAAKYPDVVIRTFAYVSTEEIPDGILPEKNVMIWLCDLYSYSDHERPLGEGPLNKKRGDLVEGWAKLVPNIQMWDYMLTGPQRGGSFPEVNARALASDAKLYRRCGIQRVFLEASYGGAAFWDLNAFLAGQLYFNPDADVGKSLDRYCRMYGAAAPQMRKAIDYLMARMAEAPPPTFLEWSSRSLAWRNQETFTELMRMLEPVYAAQTVPSVRARVADVLLETCRELLPALKSDDSKSAEYARVRADSVKYLADYLPYSVLGPKDRETLKSDFEGMLAMLEADFSDKPAVFDGVKRSDMVAMDYHSLDPRTRKQKVVADAKSSVGYACWWGDGTHQENLTGGIYDTTTCEYPGRFVAKLAADESGYSWHRMGVGSITKSSMLYLTKSWVPNFGLGRLYRSCDGMDDVNNWEVWASVRRGDDEKLLIDRVLLRRVPAGTK